MAASTDVMRHRLKFALHFSHPEHDKDDADLLLKQRSLTDRLQERRTDRGHCRTSLFRYGRRQQR